MSTPSWDALASVLAKLLPVLLDCDTVILSYGHRYVQVQQTPVTLHAEAVADDGLPTDERLTADQQRRLVELGWAPPSPPAFYNWWRQLSWPPDAAGSAAFARLLAATLAEIYSVPDVNALASVAFNSRTGKDIVLPELAGLLGRRVREPEPRLLDGVTASGILRGDRPDRI